MSKTLYVDSETKNRLEASLPRLFSMVLFLKLLHWIWATASTQQRKTWTQGFLAEIDEGLT